MNKKMMLSKIKHVCLAGLLSCSLLFGLGVTNALHSVHANASHTSAYDISQWQGYISNRKAKELKHEVRFMIIRGEDGSNYQDTQLSHNARVLSHNHVPYGVYDYSIYHNKYQANREARSLYYRAPQAKFYINDAEINMAGRRFGSATKAWAEQMHRLTPKPVVLYSDMAFMNSHTNHDVRKHYNAIWLAAYSSLQPRVRYHYDLWQYSSSYKSRALHQRVDADTIVKGGRPLSFWTGNDMHAHAHKRTVIRKAPNMQKLPDYNTLKFVK